MQFGLPTSSDLNCDVGYSFGRLVYATPLVEAQTAAGSAPDW